MNFPIYRPDQAREACGTGFVADIAGKPSFRVREMALIWVTNQARRGALNADARTSDGLLTTGSEETCLLPRG